MLNIRQVDNREGLTASSDRIIWGGPFFLLLSLWLRVTFSFPKIRIIFGSYGVRNSNQNGIMLWRIIKEKRETGD